MNIPSEFITLLCSSLLATILPLSADFLRSKDIVKMLELKVIIAKVDAVTKIKKCYNPSLEWTHHLIAITCVFSIIVFPKIVPLLAPNVPIYFGYYEIKESFLYFFSVGENMHWTQLKGLVVTPLDTHLICAIAGHYSGSAFIETDR